MTDAEQSHRWTTDRKQIFEALEAKDSDAAEFYKTAIDALAGPLSRTSLMVAAHCIRELISVLPVVLDLPTTARANASRAARELNRAWVAGGLAFDGTEVLEAEAVAVPASVFLAARDVANAGACGSKNSRELTALIVTGQTAEADTAAIGRVHNAIEWFRGRSHARDYTKPERDLPQVTRVLQELEIVEQALLNRLGNMADRARSLRTLLAAANLKTEENRQ